ncbi:MULTISPECIES: hypothetical protein [Streptomyces]|uniref:Uncharacterized protein n=2 Tax=Streptomyces TaxID=1883 RepID=A0A1D8G5C1_9ACTN|nr:MULTISPECIES: hypothetical protein [Streptomyces]AOT60651.1 hypothetical protein A4G23_03526 [Streptomyces rubrolavendulae]KAF0647327.1 hypothetical protein K701_24245 [Streptomyces fradiae ATCC 10745 = DSM 40063]OSY54244.1 hypothetical protein BG846_00080 [Streptomyces fradiae ATCC 10745 = DSM 40063]QEV13749.1 hypothetical protein CP974_19125 [Streptomyces fradiae ATCC 10745 = DSM 40063]
MSPTTSTTPNLVELIARADERGLAAAALACLDRCLPLLAPEATDQLRPLWLGVARAGDGWPDRLAEARSAVAAVAAPVDTEEAALVRRMLDGAPGTWASGPLREWADTCSLAALELHHRLCAAPSPGLAEVLERCRTGGPEGVGPLADGELRRQVRVLEVLADGAAGGLRRALDLAAEGRRVVQAVRSRRARTA